MADAPKPKDLDRTNVPQFAITNVAELLERSAYYGFVSILGLYLTQLGYEGGAVGAIGAILLAFPYVIPLLSGAIAEKVGYRPTMVVALACYTAGFALLVLVPNLGGILGGILLLATGAGGFKPVATATIAHVTAERHRSFGYTIYYTGINVGGFLGPILVTVLTDSYRAGFLVAGALMASCLTLIAIAFRNPQPPQRTSIAQALAKLGAILEDRKLIVLLAIFSGFWFLYSMNFSFMPLYLDRFVALPSWFEASLQQSFNPLVIIVLAVPLGAWATRREPRLMMTVGILLYLVGFTLLAFVQEFGAFLAGLFIATLGEIMAYPAFLAYIARIAPKDRVAVYQSYGFIPLFIGFFFGPLASGPFYQALAVEAGRPEMFWAVPISVGTLALVGFLLLAARDRSTTGERRTATGRALLALLFIPVLFVGAALAGTQAAQDGADLTLSGTRLLEQDGSTDEGQTTVVDVPIPANARNVTVQLTWRDEAAQGAGASNQPDQFGVDVSDAGNASLVSATDANPSNGEGRIVLTVPQALRTATTWHVRISLLDAGDQVATLPIVGGVGTLGADTANAWSLTVVAEAPAPAAS